MRILSVSGTPAAMGEAFGEACRESIPDLYERRLANAVRQARVHGGREVGEAGVLDVARACLAPTAAHHPEGFAELEGIARGANQPVEKILAMNGLTDIRDVLAWSGTLEALGGCSAYLVPGAQTVSGKLLCGQTWDLATDNMPHVLCVHRRPSEGPQTWTLTTSGCLSLIGLNEHGIAVGTTNVRTTDARPGVTYLSIIHKALSAQTLEQAEAAVVGDADSGPVQRAGAHFYYLGDGQGRALALECTPFLAERVEVSESAYVHTNHCLVPAHVEVEGNTPSTSSHARQARLEQLIAEASAGGSADLDASKAWMGDRANGAKAISRTDFDNISTNGAVVMEPESGTIHVCHGPPHDAQWLDLRALAN